PQGRHAGGPTGRAGEQVRAGHQCRDCQNAWSHCAGQAARRRRRGDRMRRREFITVASGAAITWPLTAGAPRSGLSRAGLLVGTSLQFSDAFQQGLRDAGFVEGQNVLFERRFARGDYERLPALAAELLALRVDVLAAFGTAAVRAAKTASVKSASAIPIIFA